jgi:DNA replication licensing factor MCM6
VLPHRFDLLHVMLDELTEEDDGRIAAHIVALHKDPAATIGRAPFTMEQLQRYIKYARAIKPRITKEVGGMGLYLACLAAAAAAWAP